MPDARGYSYAFVKAVEKADGRRPEIQFARACIKAGIPVTRVARDMGVSRMTVYNWFSGVYRPREAQLAKMHRLTSDYKLAA